VTIAEYGYNGEVRYLVEFDTTPQAAGKLVARLPVVCLPNALSTTDRLKIIWPFAVSKFKVPGRNAQPCVAAMTGQRATAA